MASSRRDAQGFQGHHLVLHQGDQRGDHQGNPLQQQGGNLVAQEFSPVPGLPRELSLLFLYKPRIQVVR